MQKLTPKFLALKEWFEDMYMKNLTEQLLSLKEQFEHRRILRAEAKGRLDEILRRLYKDFGCDDLAEAEACLSQLLDETILLKQEIEEGLKEVAQQLGSTSPSTKN